jgi:glutathione S-transferase
MKLYGTPPTRVLRAQWLVNELGLDCEMIPVDLAKGEHRSPAFLALNPAGKVPVLVDGDLVVTESAAIALYLAEKRPEAGLIPTDLATRAAMYRWIFFLVTEIEQPLWRIALHSFVYPEAMRVADDIPLAMRDCTAMLAVLDSHMTGRTTVVGDRLTVADFVAAYTLDWASEAGLLGDAPALRAYLKAMYGRPTAPITIAAAFGKAEAAAG